MAVYGKEYLWNRHIYVIFIAFSHKKNQKQCSWQPLINVGF